MDGFLFCNGRYDAVNECKIFSPRSKQWTPTKKLLRTHATSAGILSINKQVWFIGGRIGAFANSKKTKGLRYKT